eukprot:CAMPEP_0181203962 /NCGR_PEP_ID=MMETSP1096-20121128/19677_1 /TAXON_ID=156174 ORGANISM="Chrysochromulina ericina, Strain CCMP281" /NCGR_SAMPLE_ID=MMETSP1096 /ASSEMBLY_ACC=CAM_ASM_000453 /LENGTH=154 /DNA_ID=CAMNT_0023294621 /DNA_START=268 /DNA_END=732 /DNA_ORIENTATION=-
MGSWHSDPRRGAATCTVTTELSSPNGTGSFVSVSNPVLLTDAASEMGAGSFVSVSDLVLPTDAASEMGAGSFVSVSDSEQPTDAASEMVAVSVERQLLWLLDRNRQMDTPLPSETARAAAWACAWSRFSCRWARFSCCFDMRDSSPLARNSTLS